MSARTTALVLAMCAMLAACGDIYQVPQWELFVEGQSQGTITIPTHPESLPDSETTYRLETEVVIPQRYSGHAVDFVIPMLMANIRLTIDGVEIAPATRDLVTGYRTRGVQVWHVPEEFMSGTRRFVLSVDHTFMHSGWLDTVPRLERAEGVTTSSLLRVLNVAGAWVGLVSLAQIGLIYLAVFAFDRRRKKFLWFALQGLLASYYPFWLLGLSQGIFGKYDINLIGLVLGPAAVMSVYFTHLHFELGPASRIWRYLGAGAVVMSLASLDPFFVPWLVALATLIVFGVVAIYQLTTCAKLSLKKERPVGSLILLVCWTVLLILGFGDFIAWIGLGEIANGARMAPWGLALFAIMQSLILSQEHFSTLNRADNLNSELAEQVDMLESKNVDVEHLNQELRRQIAQRSHQLFAALALIEGGVKDAPRLAIGDEVQGRYRVLREIGRGGMGYVYEVERLSDKKHLALKMAAGISAVSLARFAREAKLFATLDHPRIVGIIDVDVAASGFLYLVMEYVEGESLRQREDRFGDIPWALHILGQVAEGLAELHKAGIVHRDLKPANILLSGSSDEDLPDIKITDFGVSRLSTPDARPTEGEPGDEEAGKRQQETISQRLRRHDARPKRDDLHTLDTQPLYTREQETAAGSGRHAKRKGASPSDTLAVTQIGEVTGTPHYIAPEAAKGESGVAPISDMFSLGVLGFEILVGSRPFAFPAVLTAVAGRDAVEAESLAASCPALPPEIAKLLQACLSLSPEGRPSAQVFVDAIGLLMQQEAGKAS